MQLLNSWFFKTELLAQKLKVLQKSIVIERRLGLIVSRLLYTLLEWIMIAPTEIMSNQNISGMVFDVIESALLETSENSIDTTSHKEIKQNKKSNGILIKESGSETSSIKLDKTIKNNDVLTLLGLNHVLNEFPSIEDEFEPSNISPTLIAVIFFLSFIYYLLM